MEPLGMFQGGRYRRVDGEFIAQVLRIPTAGSCGQVGFQSDRFGVGRSFICTQLALGLRGVSRSPAISSEYVLWSSEMAVAG